MIASNALRYAVSKNKVGTFKYNKLSGTACGLSGLGTSCKMNWLVQPPVYQARADTGFPIGGVPTLRRGNI